MVCVMQAPGQQYFRCYETGDFSNRLREHDFWKSGSGLIKTSG